LGDPVAALSNDLVGGRTSMVDPEIAMRLPRVKSPSQISKFCVIEPTRFLQCVGVLIGQ
jgi:hypothetical protein